MAFEVVSPVDDMMIGVDPDSPYYDKVRDSVSKLQGLPLLLMMNEAADNDMTIGQFIESRLIDFEKVGYTEDPKETELMEQPLDNTEADMLARAYALAEDEYMAGVAPTNINPLFELGTRDGRHRGMFGSLPQTGIEAMVPAEAGEELKTAGYRTGNLLTGSKPFLANYSRNRASTPDHRPNAYLSPELEQQMRRPVLADPYLSTPEILAHEAGHAGSGRFIRARINDVLPLMAERSEKLGKDGMNYSASQELDEYLVELFEPVSMSEATTTSGVTDAERAAVQDYFRGEAVDRDLISPALQQALDSLIDYQEGKPEGSRPRPRLRSGVMSATGNGIVR